jgi:hypothetical protein
VASTMPDSENRKTVRNRSPQILVRFTGAPSVKPEMYDETMKRLEESAAGQWPPDGLAFHVAFNSAGRFRVSEIWDSREQFDAGVERLMPVLTDVGIELEGQPEMLEVHNIIQR